MEVYSKVFTRIISPFCQDEFRLPSPDSQSVQNDINFIFYKSQHLSTFGKLVNPFFSGQRVQPS